jgi:hypothetical protein
MATAVKSGEQQPLLVDDQTITRIDLGNIVQPRPLPKPTSIELDVTRVMGSDWQIMGPNGRLNAYLQVGYFFIHLIRYFSYPNIDLQC